jgi:terminal uridylyltransferase
MNKNNLYEFHHIETINKTKRNQKNKAKPRPKGSSLPITEIINETIQAAISESISANSPSSGAKNSISTIKQSNTSTSNEPETKSEPVLKPEPKIETRPVAEQKLEQVKQQESEAKFESIPEPEAELGQETEPEVECPSRSEDNSSTSHTEALLSRSNSNDSSFLSDDPVYSLNSEFNSKMVLDPITSTDLQQSPTQMESIENIESQNTNQNMYHSHTQPSYQRNTSTDRPRTMSIPFNFITDQAYHMLSYIILSPHRFNELTRLHHIVGEIITSHFPNAQVHAIGSFKNNLALWDSDVDLNVEIDFEAHDPHIPSRSAFILQLEQIMNQSKEQLSLSQIKSIPTSKFPILKLTTPSGIKIDIGVNNTLSIHNSQLLLTYTLIDSRVRDLILLVKYFAKVKGINSPTDGTLSSYGYALMVLYYLQNLKYPIIPSLQSLIDPHYPPPQHSNLYFISDPSAVHHLYPTKNHQTLGSLLYGFFKFYAYQFDYNNSSVGIHLGSPNGVALNHYPRVDSFSNCFHIIDPFDHSFNVARIITPLSLITIRSHFKAACHFLSHQIYYWPLQNLFLNEDIAYRPPPTYHLPPPPPSNHLPPTSNSLPPELSDS